jgi:hypothetical protein
MENKIQRKVQVWRANTLLVAKGEQREFRGPLSMSLDLVEGHLLTTKRHSPPATVASKQQAVGHLEVNDAMQTLKYRTTRSTIFAGSVFRVPVFADGEHLPASDGIIIKLICNLYYFSWEHRQISFPDGARRRRVWRTRCRRWGRLCERSSARGRRISTQVHNK